MVMAVPLNRHKLAQRLPDSLLTILIVMMQIVPLARMQMRFVILLTMTAMDRLMTVV